MRAVADESFSLFVAIGSALAFIETWVSFAAAIVIPTVPRE